MRRRVGRAESPCRLVMCALAMVALWMALPSAASGLEPAVTITLVNYSKVPVYATAVPIDQADVAAKLGVPADAPIRITTADGKPVPLVRARENGRAVLRLYASLGPTSRLDFVARQGDGSPPYSPATAGAELVGAAGARLAPFCDGRRALRARLDNGLVRLTIGPGGWSLGFAAKPNDPAKLLLERGKLDFWVDDQNRGRITNSAPRDLGLAEFAASSLESCDASVSPEGRPSVRLVRKMNGLASRMKVIETFELVPGLPVLVYRIRWQNDGETPLWVAYVSSGSGVSGAWARELMPAPLIEHKKSATLGDLNGGETRCAWLGGLCRISMESLGSGCGVGLSTLLPTPGAVGQGSMIWGCNAGGFQCNFIDPQQGQFPFLVKPRAGLDNGFLFFAGQTGDSAFRNTAQLWAQTSGGKPLSVSPPCAVFVDGRATAAQAVSETGDAATTASLLLAEGNVRRCALRIDPNKSIQCRISVETRDPKDAVELTAKPLGGGKPAVVLLGADKSGEYTASLTDAFAGKGDVSLLLEATLQGSAKLTGFSAGECLPAAPEPLAPVPDASITDIATMFRWKGIPTVFEYDLQWSRSADFSQSVAVHLSDSREYLWFLPQAKDLPTPGKWYWRVRGVKGNIASGWSEPRAFTVNDDHSTRPLIRPPTPQRPLFTLEATRVTDYTQFKPEIPADLAPYVAIIAEGYVEKGLTIRQFSRGWKQLPCSIMVRSHPPTWVGLSEIEWLCQNVPNFIGIQGGETLSLLYAENRGKNNGDADYYRRMLRLLAKYGRVYQEADGTYRDDKWQELWDKQGPFIKQYGPWLVLTQKNNIIRRQFYSQSCAMGLWAGGITAAHGAWEDGGFYWQNAGFAKPGECFGERRGVLKDMPRIFWDLVMVMGVSRGCTVYSLDGQTLMFSEKAAQRWPDQVFPAAIWDTDGKMTPTFERFVAPLIRGIVKHQLIPSREQVLRNVKLAVYNDRKVQGDPKAWPYYLEYGPLYAGTYGFGRMGNIDGQLWEFFPNTGRYYYIPVLPQGDQAIAGVKNLPVSRLQDTDAVRRAFDSAYPAWYQGDALCCHVGDTITVLNTHENQDVTESYSIPLPGPAFSSLAGRVGPHAYLVGKLEEQGNALWLSTNAEYPRRDTELSIRCDQRPVCRVEPETSAKEVRWDGGAKTLHVKVSHEHGAVEVLLRQDPRPVPRP